MIPLSAIQAAAERIADSSVRTPLLRLPVDGLQGEIFLKLENLQPIGSFKLRGAGNAMALASSSLIWRAAYIPRALAIWRRVWLGTQERLRHPLSSGRAGSCAGDETSSGAAAGWRGHQSVHSTAGGKSSSAASLKAWKGCSFTRFSDPAVMAGNGTIGLEILEKLPEVDAVIIPYGGGGLSSGIASAIRALKPATRLYAVEVETAAPLAASLQAGRPVEVDYTPSFVDGIGGKSVLPGMWELVSGST